VLSPYIGYGASIVYTLFVLIQPVGNVYVIVAVPKPLPVISPGTTVDAISIELDVLQVPPVGRLP
jgi:hypothetical protein